MIPIVVEIQLARRMGKAGTVSVGPGRRSFLDVPLRQSLYVLSQVEKTGRPGGLSAERKKTQIVR
jgi:hypothetical protein